MGGCECNQWEAQWQLSCMITAIFYGRRIDKEDRKGTLNIEWECQRGSSHMRRCR